MEEIHIAGSFEDKRKLEIQGDSNQSAKIEYRTRSIDSDGMIVFHRYQYSNRFCLSFADEESKLNFIRLSLMPEFPEITVKHFSIYYLAFDEKVLTVEQYFESCDSIEKLAKTLDFLEKLIELIIKVHSLKICLLQLRTNKIFVDDGQLKLYFPVDLHQSRDDFNKNYNQHIEPMNGFEKDVMDFALIIVKLVGGDIKKYKRVDMTEMNNFIQSLKGSDNRKNVLCDLACQIFSQEINYNQLKEIKDLIIRTKGIFNYCSH